MLAFAVPRGIKLLTRNISVLKRQVPFDYRLMNRFHLVFFAENKQPGEPLKLKSEDVSFLKNYIAYCRSRSVIFSKEHEHLVEKFMAFIRDDQEHFAVDITEKIAAGIKKLAMARARMHMRTTTSEADVKEAMKIMRDSLYIAENPQA